MSGYLNEREVARELKVRPDTVKRWRKDQRGPVYYKFEGTVRYRREDVEAYKESRKVEPA